LFGMSVTAYLYIANILAWYFVIPVMGLFISILHELEHDLIHDMYFKEKKWIQNVMFACIWIGKLSANPWWRKPMHLKHHKTSGQMDDIEERLIGLGLPFFSFSRILVTFSPLGTYLMMPSVAADSARMNSLPTLSIFRTSIVNLPILVPAHAALAGLFLHAFIGDFWYQVCWNTCVLLFLPNVVRQACLQIVSTGVHYFGDIPEKNVFYQNQVINHWAFYPLQAFCFNFGATHILHHYVTRQTFYLRQMSAGGAVQELMNQGVRFNDLNIYKRQHRFARGDEKVETQLLAGA